MDAAGREREVLAYEVRDLGEVGGGVCGEEEDQVVDGVFGSGHFVKSDAMLVGEYE